MLTNNNNNINKTKTAPSATANFANFDESVTTDTDFFAAFNDNFNKSKNTIDTDDAFGDTKSSSPLAADRDFQHTTTLIKANNLKNNNVTKNAFNDDFDDSFGSLRISNSNKTSNNNNNNTTNTNSKTTDKFGFDDFGADFSKFDAFAAASTTSKLKKANNMNGGAIPKSTNHNETAAKPSGRYAGDYSKTDQFEDDLQAVLQRSLVDQ